MTVSINSEPLLMPTRKEIDEFVNKAAEVGVFSVNFYTFTFTRRAVLNINENLLSLYDYNESERYVSDGKYLIKKLRDANIKVGVPDYINFPYENDCNTCCGFNFDTRNKFTIFGCLDKIKKTGIFTKDDLNDIINDATYINEYQANEIKNLWGKKTDKYFLDDIKNITYSYKDDCYKYKEVKRWF